jgi:transposase InsO family protein
MGSMGEAAGQEHGWRVEQRYRAVLEVRDGSPVTEVALRYGVSRQTVYTWRDRFERDGITGLQEASRRPRNSPQRMDAGIEALVCELRRAHRRWGARRIAFELARRGVEPVPARATIHRALARNGLVKPQDQQHQRRYKRWQREAPMQLWQLDIVGGVFLADGRECKIVTGIDDHSRFIVIAALAERPTGRAVCEAFAGALSRYGVPSEVLSDNGKQFTGRFTKPVPAEVLFERVCRENGITQRLTKRRSPTTTGKIERWHRTLREELLNPAGPFASFTAAQEAIAGWVQAYNYSRPHQSLNMATPASLFRPAGVHGPSAVSPVPAPAAPAMPRLPVQAPPAPPPGAGAVELELTVPASGVVPLAGRQQIWLGPAYGGRTVTAWADDRSVHILLDGYHIKTVASRLDPSHLQELRMRGARPAGPPPAAPALPARNGRTALPAGTAVETDRAVSRDGTVTLAGQTFAVHPGLVGQRITLRLDDHLMHAIAGGQLVGTWPLPFPAARRTALRGARPASGPAPALTHTTAMQARRRVPADGVIMVARQRLRVGRTHAGKTVTVIAEDTHFRILDGDQELAVHPRTTSKPVTRFKAYATANGK